MSRTGHQHLEEGIHPVDGHRDQPPSALDRPSQRLEGGFNFGDSSGPLFIMYSEIAENEDDKMTDRWQKDADGILIFTGLFSATVATLLSVSVQDLRPNSQDTSAFYLANIYQIFADPNATLPRTSIPSTLAIPPPFSPPRYAIWVNSLWFLSLVISLTCAVLATSLQQWARRYIRFTQPARCSPEKRARMRAFFADGVDKMHLPSTVETLPFLIHFSLFLFFAGLAIFLFNINHRVFTSVIWWIGLFATVYGWVTMMPIFRHDSPYYVPLSSTAWSLYASMLYAFFTVLTFITSGSYGSMQTLRRFRTSRKRYGDWMVGGVLKAAEETASKQSPGIDLGILDWTIGTLGDDDSLERFFEAIPGFFNSQMAKDIKKPLPYAFSSKFVDSLCGFLDRNLLSNTVREEVKTRRLLVCMNAANAICDSHDIYGILSHLSRMRFDKIPQSVQTAQILTRWCTSSEDYISRCARQTVASILRSVRERDDHWIALVKDQFGLPEHVLRDNIAHGDDSVLLTILIHVARQVIHTDPSNPEILWSLAKFDIHNTLSELQNEFCALWNEVVLQARNEFYPHVFVLVWLRHLYIALHQGTDAAPTAFSASTTYGDPVLAQPSSYPSCNIATHHPNSTHDHVTAFTAVLPINDSNHGSPHPPVIENYPIQGDSIVPQTKEASIIPGPFFTDHTLSRGTSLSPITDPIHIFPKITSVVVPSTHDPIENVTPALNPFVSMEVSHHSRSREKEEIPESSGATLLTFVQPEPVPSACASSTTPHPPLFPMQHTIELPDISRPTSVPLSHPRDPDDHRDIAALRVTSDIIQNSSMAIPIRQCIPSIGATVQTSDESSGMLPTADSVPMLSPVLMPSLHIDTNPVEFPSSV